MNQMKYTALILTAILTLLFSPAAHGEETISAEWSAIEDTEFGAVCIGCALEEFLAAGFRLGDSCDLEFSNGFRAEDVPVYDGYYSRSGSMAVVLYPGYEYPHFDRCTVGGMWALSGASASDTVRVTLREREKYLAVQQSLSMVYSTSRDDFGTDEEFANFRPLSGGKLKKDRFYRGASPVDNRYGRASTVDRLMRDAGVTFVLDLADTREKAEAFEDYPGSCMSALDKKGNVRFLAMNMSVMSEDFGAKLLTGLRAMTEQDGPVYIHCTEGKDRTGFVCLLLECLAGADYEELEKDYMLTYRNYYRITQEGGPDKYAAVCSVKLMDLICLLTGLPDSADLASHDFRPDAENWLLRNGMTSEEVAELEKYLTE